MDPNALVGVSDSLLSEWAANFTGQAFVADQIAPRVSVDLQAGKYPVHGREHLRLRVDTATPRSEVSDIELELSADEYYAGGHALKHFVPTRNRATLAEAQAAVDHTMEGILLNREKAVADYVTDASVVPNSEAPSAPWTGASTDVSEFIRAQRAAVAARTGVNPNVLVIGPDVLAVLAENSALLDRIRYTQTGILTEDLLGTLFGGLTVIVPSAVAATSAEGQPIAAGSVWPAATGLLFYRAAEATMASRSAFKSPVWKLGLSGQAVDGAEVRRWRDEGRGTDGGEWIQSCLYYGLIAPNAAAAQRLTDLVA